MGTETAIEWTDHTFNPWIGCTNVSPACDNCYAEKLVTRYGWAKWGAGEPRKRTSATNWHKPMQWNRAAAKAGTRRRVFCASLADVFDAEVPDRWRLDLMQLIHATPSLDWQLLTKRPQVAKKWFDVQAMPSNIWMGTTVEDQKMADLRIPILLSIPAKVRFLSCEPLLEKVRLKDEWLMHLDWIICGGESGPGARSMNPSWARSLRDDCVRSGTYFFFKQWGDWMPDGPTDHAHTRVGKKVAGALLDGREYREFPRSAA
jgi:protein gp37